VGSICHSVQPTIDSVVSQHAELTAQLWSTRRLGSAAPNWSLLELGRFDERIEANIDGLRVAGEAGWRACETMLESGDPGAAFVAAVLAIEAKDRDRFRKLLKLAEVRPAMWAGLGSAVAWVSAADLTGTVQALLNANVAALYRLGLTACTMHRVDPGAALEQAIARGDPKMRIRAIEAVGKVGRTAFLNAVLKAASDVQDEGRCWGAWSGVLLGDRGAALNALCGPCSRPSPRRFTAMQVLLRAVDVGAAQELLRGMAREEPKDERLLIQAVGIVGDPHFVPWLIERMADLKLARLAGESFTFITGADLALLDLECRPPEGVEFGPTDDPEDENVDMDPDEGLPWPDQAKVLAWWQANQQRFPAGTRQFMGAPPSVDHCQHVLREGHQRQRIAASLFLSLLRPGTPLFPTAAPTWRQRRWLAETGG
jgi:uncharacterized protein (TIGR02270 family)